MIRSLKALAVVAVLCASAAPSAAEEPSEERLHFRISPYVWVASLEGDVATLARLPAVEVDASFSDILEKADLALMLAAEVRYDRFGVTTDFSYMELSIEEGSPLRFFNGVDFETDTFFATFKGFYRAVEEERFILDVLAGLRLWDVATVLKFKPGLLPGLRTSDDDTWADPVFGARGSAQLLGSFFITAGADIGGFGAASDLTWQMIGTVDWVPTPWLAIRAGYRHLDVDYHHGDFEWDIAMSGPIVGATLRF